MAEVKRLKVQPKKKKLRLSRSEEYFANVKYMGEEPEFKREPSKAEYIQCLNWYNKMCSMTEAREYMNTYLLTQNRHDDIARLEEVKDSYLPLTACWIARMLTRSVPLPEMAREFMEARLNKSYHPEQNMDPEPSSGQETPILILTSQKNSRAQDRIYNLLGDIEEQIDKVSNNFSLYGFLQQKQPKSGWMHLVVSMYTPIRDEIKIALDESDEQVNEAYGRYSKKWLRARLDLFNRILADAEKYAGIAKTTAVRKPRPNKPIDVQKKMKNVLSKYQKESKEFNLTSIDPIKILNSKELWLFNTKYRTITVLRSEGDRKLDVDGSSITNYDEKTSISKKTGRNTQNIIRDILILPKVPLKKMIEGIEVNQTISTRVTEHVMFIKAVT